MWCARSEAIKLVQYYVHPVCTFFEIPILLQYHFLVTTFFVDKLRRIFIARNMQLQLRHVMFNMCLTSEPAQLKIFSENFKFNKRSWYYHEITYSTVWGVQNVSTFFNPQGIFVLLQHYKTLCKKLELNQFDDLILSRSY